MLLNLCSHFSHITARAPLSNLQTSHQVQYASRISILKRKSSGWHSRLGGNPCSQKGSPVRLARTRSRAVDINGSVSTPCEKSVKAGTYLGFPMIKRRLGVFSLPLLPAFEIHKYTPDYREKPCDNKLFCA